MDKNFNIPTKISKFRVKQCSNKHKIKELFNSKIKIQKMSSK